MCAFLLVSGSCTTGTASAFDFVSEKVPDGFLAIAAQGESTLFLDVSAGELMQWTWSAHTGKAEDISTRLYWTDAEGADHETNPLPAGHTSGNFEAPDNLLGARLVWTNTGQSPAMIKWDYYSTAHFWRRPEYFLPALLPVFLVLLALHFGRRIDATRATRRGSTVSDTTTSGPDRPA
ncbi:MAG: hypothetical protein DWQ08_01095 [Proteobacteria bacterium]|nr:MAG: hypothetical protein DWQ08_01095 [Pseudomonadota bacterium]